MAFERALSKNIRICQTQACHAAQLAVLQTTVFPDLEPGERFGASAYREHIRIFPEGQFVAIAGERVVGMTTTLRLDERTAFAQHRFAEIIGDGTLPAHDSCGPWLYGADMGIDPEWRGHRIGRALYAVRHEVVARLGLLGQVTVGMLNGYAERGDECSLEEYYEQVVSGRRKDPTLSMQMHIGFEPCGLVRDYLRDPTCGDAGVRLVLPATKPVPISWWTEERA